MNLVLVLQRCRALHFTKIERDIMAGIRQESAQTVIEYQAEPAIVAQVVQDILAGIGSVTDVSRETGIISGKIKIAWMDNAAVIIRVSRKGDATELNIQATKGEYLFTGGGAQKAISIFTQEMSKDKRLQGKSAGGW
jgi:hypothetical protein